MTDVVRAEFEGVAAAGDVGEGVAGEGRVAAALVGVELEVSGVCDGREGRISLL